MSSIRNGLAAIIASLAFLSLLFISIIGNGYSAVSPSVTINWHNLCQRLSGGPVIALERHSNAFYRSIPF